MTLEEFISARRLGDIPKIEKISDFKFVPLLSQYIQNRFVNSGNKLSKLKTCFEVSEKEATISIYRGELGKYEGVGAYMRLGVLNFKQSRWNPEKCFFQDLVFSLAISQKKAPKLRLKIKREIDKILAETWPDNWFEFVSQKDLDFYKIKNRVFYKEASNFLESEKCWDVSSLYDFRR